MAQLSIQRPSGGFVRLQKTFLNLKSMNSDELASFADFTLCRIDRLLLEFSQAVQAEHYTDPEAVQVIEKIDQILELRAMQRIGLK